MTRKPEILAPAGDTQSFLAAMAAGADAVYLGLKHFSARMQADNFGSAELSRMVELANENGRRIYVAFNTLVKPDDVPAAGRLIARLARDVKPHGPDHSGSRRAGPCPVRPDTRAACSFPRLPI